MVPRRRAHVLPNEFMELERRTRLSDREPDSLCSAWENAVSSYTETKEAVAVNSGRRAMLLILRYLGVGEGDEVIVPALTLFSLLPLIESLGAVPVPVDISSHTLNLCPDCVQSAMSDRTRVIIALHAFGLPCEIETLVELGNRHGIPVVEDCAHAMGANVASKKVGSFGFAGFFSFEPTKPINTYGGGMVVTDDTDLAAYVREQISKDVPRPEILIRKARAVQMEQTLYRSNLMLPVLLALDTSAFNTMIGGLYRKFQAVPPTDSAYLTIQAELGLRKIISLDERIQRRQYLVQLYRELLKPVVKLPPIHDGVQSTWYFMVATLPIHAASIRRRLLLRGIDAIVGAEIADDCASIRGLATCPVLHEVYPYLIGLPLYDGMTEVEVARVARAINDQV